MLILLIVNVVLVFTAVVYVLHNCGARESQL